MAATTLWSPRPWFLRLSDDFLLRQVVSKRPLNYIRARPPRAPLKSVPCALLDLVTDQ